MKLLAVTILAITLLTPATALAGQQQLTRDIANDAAELAVTTRYPSAEDVTTRCKKIKPKQATATCTTTYYHKARVYVGKLRLTFTRDATGTFTRGIGKFNGSWNSENEDCKKCSGKEHWTQRFTIPADEVTTPIVPTETPTEDPTPEEIAQQNIAKQIFDLILGCSGSTQELNCKIAYYPAFVAGGAKYPRYIVASIDAVYVAHNATENQKSLMECWLSWKPDHDLGSEGGWTGFQPPACTKQLLIDHPELGA